MQGEIVVGLSRRALSAKRNGRLGGLKTASTHSQEFLEARATRAGLSTRDTYGLEYYQHLRTLHPTTKKKSIRQLAKETVSSIKAVSNTALMTQAVESLGLN